MMLIHSGDKPMRALRAHARQDERQRDGVITAAQRTVATHAVFPHRGLEELQRLAGNHATTTIVQPLVRALPTVQRDDGAPQPGGLDSSEHDIYAPDFIRDMSPGIAKFARALAALFGWMTVYHVVMELSRAQSTEDALNVVIRAGLLGGLLRGDLAAEVIPQSWLIALAQREVDAKGPLARLHLDHYLAGSGDDFVEDVARLYRDDDGIRAATEREIVTAQTLNGAFPLFQGDFTNAEWQYSLGAIDSLRYELIQPRDDIHGDVRIALRDPYEWHPHEYRTWSSHLAHVALERAKENGARNFWEVGQATVALRVGRGLIERLRSDHSP